MHEEERDDKSHTKAQMSAVDSKAVFWDRATAVRLDQTVLNNLKAEDLDTFAQTGQSPGSLSGERWGGLRAPALVMAVLLRSLCSGVRSRALGPGCAVRLCLVVQPPGAAASWGGGTVVSFLVVQPSGAAASRGSGTVVSCLGCVIVL